MQNEIVIITEDTFITREEANVPIDTSKNIYFYNIEFEGVPSEVFCNSKSRLDDFISDEESNRVQVIARGVKTGAEYQEALKNKLLDLPNIKVSSSEVA